MKKIEGRYKIVLVVLLCYVTLMAVLFGKKIFTPQAKTYLLIGTSAKWKFDGQNWKNIAEDEKDLYAWKNYDIFINQQKFGTYQVAFSEKKWYLFTKEKTPVNYQGDFLGIRSNKPYEVASFERVALEASDTTYINQVYEKNNLKPNQAYTDGYKVLFDIDSDGEKETIYTVSNLFPFDFVSSKIFNFVFVVDHNRIQMVYQMIDDFTNMYNHCKIRLQYLIDIDKSGTYEIILNCNYYSTQGTCTSMYQKRGSKFQRIKTCNQ